MILRMKKGKSLLGERLIFNNVVQVFKAMYRKTKNPRLN